MALFREEATSLQDNNDDDDDDDDLEQSQADLSHPEQTVSSYDSFHCTEYPLSRYRQQRNKKT